MHTPPVQAFRLNAKYCKRSACVNRKSILFVHLHERDAQMSTHSSETLERAVGSPRIGKHYILLSVFLLIRAIALCCFLRFTNKNKHNNWKYPKRENSI